jgi:hypothetical protein
VPSDGVVGDADQEAGGVPARSRHPEEDALAMGRSRWGRWPAWVADRVAGDPRRGHPVAASGSVAAT